MMTTEYPQRLPWLLATAFAIGMTGCSGAKNEYVEPPPPAVTVAHPVLADITPFLEQTGRTEATEEADVRARVRGFLEEIGFEPGQHVSAGDVLYKIEPDQYQAIVNSAVASVAAAQASIGVADALIKTAEAEVAKAENDFQREVTLKASNASSQSQYDAAAAAAAAAKANVESAKASAEAARADKGSAEAALAQANLDLGYTQVTAPIDGEITKTLFKLGNLVENGNQLATVVDDRQIFANFSISDRDLLEFMKARKLAAKAGEIEVEERKWRGKKVYLRRETDDGFPFEGKLDYIDQSGIEAATGTLGLRASFDNSDRRLLPGLFVTVRVPAEETVKSLLIPEASLLRSSQGVFVLTVNAEDVVERARVTVGQTVSGWAIIQAGIDENSRVLIDGLQRARPKLKVVPELVTLNVDGNLLLRGKGEPGADPVVEDATANRADTTPADTNPESTTPESN